MRSTGPPFLVISHFPRIVDLVTCARINVTKLCSWQSIFQNRDPTESQDVLGIRRRECDS